MNVVGSGKKEGKSSMNWYQRSKICAITDDFFFFAQELLLKALQTLLLCLDQFLKHCVSNNK